MTDRVATASEPTLDVGRIARRVGLFVAVAVAVAVALATLPGVGEVRDRVADANLFWLVVAGLCSLASSLGFVTALWGVFDRRVRWRSSVALGFAEQGANVLLPAGGAGGPAFGTFVMRRAGVPAEHAAERHAALFLVTSGVSLLALVVFGLLAWVTGEASPAASLIPAAIGFGGIAVSVLFSHTDVPPEPAGGKLRHGLWRLRRFLNGGVKTSLELLRHGCRLLPTGSVAYYAFDVAALAASFWAFGGGGPPVALFVLAYTVGHAGALLPTPGGVGGTDGGLIAAFALYGAPLGLATAAVLGYRVFQLGVPVVLGAVSLVRIRARLSDDERRLAVEKRFAEVR